MDPRKIIVIDDDSTITSFVSYILQFNKGYEVRSLNDPFRAVEAIREFRPDLIILDVSMPGMDGGEVAASLAADPSLRKIPIIFLTAVVSQNDPLTVRNPESGHVYLPKPVEPKDLIRCVEGSLQWMKGQA
jgi:CheY-like chemotaxis protein